MIDKPYTAQGDWNMLKPDGSVLMFQGSFERDQILKLLNEAYSAGQASRSEQGMVLTDEIIGQTSAKFAEQFDDGFMALGLKARCCRLISEAIEHLRDKGYLSAPVEEVGEDQIERMAVDFCAKPSDEDGQPDWDPQEVAMCANFLRYAIKHGLMRASEPSRS